MAHARAEPVLAAAGTVSDRSAVLAHVVPLASRGRSRFPLACSV